MAKAPPAPGTCVEIVKPWPNGKLCDRPARWFVASGPCFVCWRHCVRLRSQGEEVVRAYW